MCTCTKEAARPVSPTRPWHVCATDLRVRAEGVDYVEATGWTEAEALRDLAPLLDRWRVEE